MRGHHGGLGPGDHDSENGWEVARLLGGPTIDGVRMAGFRDRASAGLDMRVLPQPVVVLVIGLGESPLTVESATARRPLRSFVASLSPGRASVRGENVECVEVCLPPLAARAVLGVSPRELDGAVNGLEDLWGRPARCLRERMTDATSWQERLELTDAFLAERAAGAPSVSPEVAAAWDTIVARRGRVRVAGLAASFGWSRKRLWSRFTDQVGLTPKRAAMLVRFDHAARALCAGESADTVAFACGYADQSHLHRDVTALAGCTPRALAGRSTSAGRPSRA
ncbi:helix-turn-helix domain-containing protein [Streptomyces sp. NPDC020330]|uniref:helix-turn-helix domain-containing protein n=1 Tax=unclassified Streptomyces TaxID=2593676 RepID=UPI0037B172ED